MATKTIGWKIALNRMTPPHCLPHIDAFASLAHSHVKPQAFGRCIFHMEFPQRIADRLRQDLFPREQQNRHAPQALAGLLVVLDLADQGHAGTAALFLQLEVERVIPGLVEGLSAQALLGTYACGQGFAETVERLRARVRGNCRRATALECAARSAPSLAAARPGRNAARTEEPEPANRYGQPRPTCLAVRLCADTSGSRRRDDVPWPLVLAPRLSRARSLSIWRTRNASMDSSSVERFVRKRTAAQPGRHARPGVGRSIEPAEAWESRPAAQEVGSRIERLEIAQLLDHQEGISHRC